MKKRGILLSISGLLMGVIVAIVLYLSYETYGNWEFAFLVRGKKLIAFILVALAVSFSTITFQTLTQNRFLTPEILGIDQLYGLIQTLVFFSLGGKIALTKITGSQFLLNVLLLASLSVVFILFFLKKSAQDLFLLLLVGLIASSLFSSISTFLQVLMDPNEYELLQGKLFASFGNVMIDHLGLAFCLLFMFCGLLWYFSPELDVLQLGIDQGINLGVAVYRLQRLLLFLVAGATGVATALVGPTIFLGFITASISYEVFRTYSHRQLFLGSTLIAILFLVFGQFMLEQVLALNTTIGTVIQFVGGIFFVGKIIVERKKG